MNFECLRLLQLIILHLILLTHLQDVQGQANKVSSKLDFGDNVTQQQQQQQNNTNVPVLRGGGGQNNDANEQGIGRDIGRSGGGVSSTGVSVSGGDSSGGGKRPKIHGVRVTVDTDDGQKSKESKESVETSDYGKHKKRVGIHTDITFEISTDNDTNETNSAQNTDKEDASVPIYKGRGGSESKHKSHKGFDPKSQWNPNFSTERRGGGGYDGFYGGDGSKGAGYPQYYPQHNVPVYAASETSDAGSIYRSGDSAGWVHYVPVWTTERSPSEQSQVYRRPSWKPCYCMSSYDSDYRRRRDSTNTRNKPTLIKPTSAVIQIIDGKLERPFS